VLGFILSGYECWSCRHLRACHTDPKRLYVQFVRGLTIQPGLLGVQMGQGEIVEPDRSGMRRMSIKHTGCRRCRSDGRIRLDRPRLIVTLLEGIEGLPHIQARSTSCDNLQGTLDNHRGIERRRRADTDDSSDEAAARGVE
jgi:hypothetical protein